MRTSMKLIAEPLMKRSRTFSPAFISKKGARAVGLPFTSSV